MISGVVDLALLADDDALRPGEAQALDFLGEVVNELAVIVAVLVLGQSALAIAEDRPIVAVFQRLARLDALQRRVDVDLALVDRLAEVNHLGIVEHLRRRRNGVDVRPAKRLVDLVLDLVLGRRREREERGQNGQGQASKERARVHRFGAFVLVTCC